MMLLDILEVYDCFEAYKELSLQVLLELYISYPHDQRNTFLMLPVTNHFKT